MFNNTYYTTEQLYRDDSVILVGELGEKALIHLLSPKGKMNKYSWKNRHKILNICLRKLRSKGYREVIARVEEGSWLLKKVKGKYRIEHMLNFKKVGESKGWFYFKTNTLL